MNDHDALLRAIGEHPEEDTPRLVYADWLEENDQPERADFVRNQIALGQPGLTNDERYPLVMKNVHYLREWVPYWRGQLPRIEGVEWGDFRRGLIEEVQARDGSPVIEHAREIFAVPGIHVLRLRWLNEGFP
ncbi:MAG: TIGR02996 domain-containing protein, partial [Gemmataceae bacterium]|nr:TIGR02996 domain-containing protein [Gemmataceae bacterium]